MLQVKTPTWREYKHFNRVADRELDVPGRQRRYPQTPHHHRHHRGFEGENKDQDRGVIRSSPPEVCGGIFAVLSIRVKYSPEIFLKITSIP